MPGVDDLNALRELGRIAAAEPQWARFARYCEQRANGVRKAALAELTAFLAEAASWPFADRKRFTAWICGRDRARQSEVMPQPLLVQLVQPTLEQWTRFEAKDPVPHYLLGLFAPWSMAPPSRSERFETALALDPGFEPARLALVDGLLADVDYSQHHLPDDYLGAPADDLILLDRAAALLADVADLEARALRLAEIDECRRQAEHWRDHGCAPPGTPPRSVTVYYKP